jgi:hypothetical protein
MTLHRNSRRARPRWAALVGIVMVFSVLGTATTLANHPEVSLAGSNFEIDTDANLKVDDSSPSIDWANVANISQQDTASGSGDESFGQGSKEDTAVPSVVDGGIPPNKSDLKFFGAYQEGAGSTGFLNLYWARVQDPSGTTNMDFEFNQSSTLSANGVTPIRMVGDLLVIYDLSQGGTNPTLSLRRWTANGWGAPVNLTTSGTATGSINTSPIASGDADGIGALSARTFGEAQLAIASIFPDPTICQSFGSAYLKSRSSDSFTAALKDFVPPVAVNISNCGRISIHKQDDAGADLAGATFVLYKDNAPVGGTRGAEDTLVAGKSCTTNADGDCSINNVLAGEYWVHESVVPAGHNAAPDQHATVVADTTVSLTFVNPRQQGSIRVTKTAKHAGPGSPNLAATFTVKKAGVSVGTITTDATTGIGCLGGLFFGAYTVEETSGQPGYQLDASVENATISAGGTCPSAPSASVSFENIPLTNLTVSVSSQVAGGTNSKITCTGLSPTPADGTPTAYDDTSETVNNLVPGVYTCTIDIDP